MDNGQVTACDPRKRATGHKQRISGGDRHMVRPISRLVATLAATAAALGMASAQTTLRWGEHLPQCCSMYAAAAQWAVNEVAKRSGGDLKIDIQYGGVLATV